MPDTPGGMVIGVFAGSPALRAYLSDIIRLAGGTAAPRDAAPEEGAEGIVLAALPDGGIALHGGGTRREFRGPVKAGVVIEAIGRLRSVRPATRDVAGHVLDMRENLWLRAGGETIRLTEKEVAILCALEDCAPAALSRQALLDRVWAYADGVETHTLETHIYRLRQKIEADPSTPAIIVTVEDGYRIGGE